MDCSNAGGYFGNILSCDYCFSSKSSLPMPYLSPSWAWSRTLTLCAWFHLRRCLSLLEAQRFSNLIYPYITEIFYRHSKYTDNLSKIEPLIFHPKLLPSILDTSSFQLLILKYSESWLSSSFLSHQYSLRMVKIMNHKGGQSNSRRPEETIRGQWPNAMW